MEANLLLKLPAGFPDSVLSPVALLNAAVCHPVDDCGTAANTCTLNFFIYFLFFSPQQLT